MCNGFMMIGQFLDYLRRERNRSERTVQNYEEDLRFFESYYKRLDSHLSWESVDTDIIRGWMESMMDKGNTATSINRRLSALRSFFRFALSRGLVGQDPAHAVKGPKKSKALPQFLKEKEMDELLDGEEMWRDDIFDDVRARTILLTFYSTGMRLSELTGLDDASVDFANRQIKVLGKGNKQRLIPFGEELEMALRRYISMRESIFGGGSGALFVTDKGLRMNQTQVRYVVKKNLSRVSSLKKRTPHVIRHTFATAMLNNGSGLESVKKLLGHESLKTTEVYTHATFEQLKRVYIKAHPRA